MSGGEPLELDYEAAAAYAAAGGEGTLSVAIDGGPEREVEVAGPASTSSRGGEHHARHHLTLRGDRRDRAPLDPVRSRAPPPELADIPTAASRN